MKKLVLLLTLFLSACGGGGGGGVTPSNNSTGGVGVLTVNIQSADTAVPAGMVAAALSPPLSTYVRVVVSNANLKYNGQAFKQIVDIPVGTTYTFSAVPASNGYSVEAVSYVVDGGLNRMIKYAKNTANITADITNSVTLSMAPIQVALNVPPALTGGAPYSVSTVFSSQPTPLRSTWGLVAQLSDFITPIHQTYASLTVYNLTAPTPFSSGTLFFQSEYFINSNLLNAGESYSNWTFNYPNPSWGEASIAIPLTVPTGDMVITVPPVI